MSNEVQTQAPAPKTQKRMTIEEVVTKTVAKYQERGEISFPMNYSPENAIKSAWLILQETVDMQKRPALEVCTRDSIANALFNMVIQGLNPVKKQCYFIVYGQQLQLQRSYFGSVAVAKQVDERIDEILGEVIYKGDVFQTKKHRGKTILVTHEQSFENIDKANITGAYANIIYKDGTDECVVMTLDQIHQSWRQSKMSVFDEKGNISVKSVHGKFTDEMCKKTVINKAAKMIINTSDDHNLIMKSFKSTDDELVEAEAKATIEEKSNKQIVDITIDTDTGEVIDNNPVVVNEVEQDLPEQQDISYDTTYADLQPNF